MDTGSTMHMGRRLLTQFCSNDAWDSIEVRIEARVFIVYRIVCSYSACVVHVHHGKFMMS